MRLGRRQFLAGTLALGATSLTAPLTRRAGAQPKFASGPFTLGVASGYPLPHGVVLWTRLAPAPLIPGGGMSPDVVVVDWEVASDDQMRQIVRRGTAAATPAGAHSVHAEVDGLEPGRWYWYRFRAGSEVSPIGRTRTAPAVNAPLERLRFAFASCQQYEQGYYGAYHRMAGENLDLLVYLGDYIYESSWGRDHVRHHGAPEPFTLEDYRIRHALYKTDPDLQASHAGVPVDLHVGRPRGLQRLRGRSFRAGAPARVVPASPRRRLPGVLRAHAAAERRWSHSVTRCACTSRSRSAT